MSRGFVKLAGLLFFAFVLSFSKFAIAEKRVALVIGNSAYQHVAELANPRNDASDMAAKLESLGFEVVQGEDLDLSAMRRTVRDFVNALEGADIALFFYAGHGLQVNGNNYMAPIDAQLANYNDLDFEMLPMDLIMSAMERNTKVNLVFLDACRDNPLAENLARSMGTRSGAVGRGLAKLGSGVGSLIAFATQPGNVALDGKGRNSPFTTALLKHLGTPGQSVTDDLVLVRREVLESTEGKQVPWDNSSLTGPVVLKEQSVEPPKPEPAPSVEAVQQTPPQDNQVELTFWNSIKDADVKELYDAYLTKYPEGEFAGLARVKITLIEKRLAEEERTLYAAKARQQAELEAKQAADEALQKQQAAETDIKAGQDATRLTSLEQSPTAPETQMPEIDPVVLARAMQTELGRLGCLSGRVDGKWGPGSQKALKDFAGRQGIKLASLEPTAEILDRMKATSVRVCPLVCGRNQEEKNGRCVAVRKEASIPKNTDETNKSSKQSPPQPSVKASAQLCWRCVNRFGRVDNMCFATQDLYWQWKGRRAEDTCRKL